VVVWVGYDNARGKRTLGSGQTGSKVAIPIFEPIMKAAWADIAPQTPLPKPSPEAARHLIALPIDLNSGQRLDGRRVYNYEDGDYRYEGRPARVSGGFMEYFRTDDSGRVNDTQERLASQNNYYGSGYGEDGSSPFFFNNPFQSFFGGGQSPPPPGYGFPRGGPGYNQEPRYVP